MGTDFLFYEGRKGTVMYANVRVKIDALEGWGVHPVFRPSCRETHHFEVM